MLLWSLTAKIAITSVSVTAMDMTTEGHEHSHDGLLPLNASAKGRL